MDCRQTGTKGIIAANQRKGINHKEPIKFPKSNLTFYKLILNLLKILVQMPSFCNYPGNLAAQLVIFVNYIDFGEDHSCDANPENR